MTLKEAAQQALAYLDGAAYAFEAAADGRAVTFAAYGKNCREAASLVRAALKEPVQPVAINAELVEALRRLIGQCHNDDPKMHPYAEVPNEEVARAEKALKKALKKVEASNG